METSALVNNPVTLGALGMLVGGIGTLVGAGGGFLLVPVLLLLFPELEPAQVTATSLAVVALNSTSGSMAYARLGRVDFGMGWRLALAMIPGVVAGVSLVSYIPRDLFQKFFSVLLFTLAAYLVAKPEKGSSIAHNGKGVPDGQQEAAYPVNIPIGIGLSAAAGFLASLLGIGGGPFHVPLLIYILRYPVSIATATSQFALAVMAWGAVLLHLLRGEYSGVWWLLATVGSGAIIGAQAGARLSQRVHDVFIVRALGVVLGTVALRLIA
ncbi:MAG: sulfite exporter TauE/SafE family protein [Armatimonadota bacterium]|nr:sulfite exporter TauE/SafE family protein [Armatimonadota bacterium]MDR5702282.1 sulfite exporter TauE/SafE family protein [Armatimonadota bacterium]MDR7435403.1 sulfite exporter TauE/SafE family protein [Armatimonadota bacterium]